MSPMAAISRTGTANAVSDKLGTIPSNFKYAIWDNTRLSTELNFLFVKECFSPITYSIIFFIAGAIRQDVEFLDNIVQEAVVIIFLRRLRTC